MKIIVAIAPSERPLGIQSNLPFTQLLWLYEKLLAPSSIPNYNILLTKTDLHTNFMFKV